MPVYVRPLDFGPATTAVGGVIIRRRDDCTLIAYDRRLTLAEGLARAATLPLTDEESEWLHKHAPREEEASLYRASG